MKFFCLAALALCLSGPVEAAYDEEGLPEAPASTETAKNGEEEDGLVLIQQSDEDLASFVTDYIRKDTMLKGAFFLEDKAAKKVLRLELASIEPVTAGAENGGKTVTAHFKDATGKKAVVVFHLQNGPWGGLDIFRLELKAAPAGRAAGKKKGG